MRLDEIPDTNTIGIRLSDIPDKQPNPAIAEQRAGRVWDSSVKLNLPTDFTDRYIVDPEPSLTVHDIEYWTKKGYTVPEAQQLIQPSQEEAAVAFGAKIPTTLIPAVFKGATSSTAYFLNELDNISSILSDYTGVRKGDMFKSMAVAFTQKADFWEKVLKEQGADGVDRFVGEVTGGLPTGIIQWNLGTGFAAVEGGARAKEEGKSVIWGALKGGAKRFILGKLLDTFSMIKSPYIRRTLGGTAFGTFSAAEGAPLPDIATQTVMGALMSGYRPPYGAKLEGFVEPELAKGKTETAGKGEIISEIKPLTDKVIIELGKAERPRDIIESQKTEELGKRVIISAQAAEQTTGEGRLFAALSPLKGELAEYKSPDFKPLKETMTSEEINLLHDDIWVRPWSQEHFDKLNTAKAWSKVTEGFVPTRGEILLLEKQWGSDFAKELLKKRPLGDKIWDGAADISNFMRTMVAGGDISVAGRQLRLLGQRYPAEYGKAIAAGAKSYASEDLATMVRKEYESSEFHQEAKKYVKFFEKAGTQAVEPSERPEWYISHYPEKIPIIGNLIRMGNRNYVETTNYFTQAIWDKLRLQDGINGVEPTKAQLTERGKWLMSMEGKPEIGGIVGRRIAPITAGFFFAPRFAISRFTSPMYLAKLASGDPVARQIGKQTAGAFASLIGTNVAILALIKLVYGDDATIELNPLSADWGKGKIGNTRIDLWSGYQQAARFLVQLVMGQYKTASGHIRDRERKDLIGTFIRSKENPLVSLISDLWAGKTYQGDKPFSAPKGEMGKKLDELGVPDIIQGVGKEAYNRMLFMWVQDFADASVNDGWPTGLAAGTLSFAGINTSSYTDTASTKLAKFKDEIAQKEYKENWEDITATEQKKLLRINKQEIERLELLTKTENVRRDDYDYVARLIEAEKKAGENIYNKLKPENQQALDEVGISLGLSRRIDDWEINDERYNRLQELTTQILDEKLSKITQSENWKDIPIKRKIIKIELAVNTAKDKAKNMVKRESKQ